MRLRLFTTATDHGDFQQAMLPGSLRYFPHGVLPSSKEKPVVVEQPRAPDVKSSGLAYADPGFDRLPALGNGAESSGGLEDPAREVGGAFPLRCRWSQDRLPWPERLPNKIQIMLFIVLV